MPITTSFPILTVIVFLPLAGGLVCLALGSLPRLVRWTALAFTLGNLGLAVSLLTLQPLPPAGAGGPWLLVEDVSWIPLLGSRYSLGLDGISLLLVLLTVFLGAVSVLVSWREITTRVGAFHFFLLLAQTSILGVFLATDLFLFYLFWEAQVIPLFFLIGFWGHQRRIQATVKFFLFNAAGSLLMLPGLVGLWLAHGATTGVYTFALADLVGTAWGGHAETWLFAAFLLAFAVKIPVVPLHLWLPDAHTEAPTAGSVILAGLLLKTGAYGLLRFAFPLFPAAAARAAPLLIALGVIGLFYTALVALAQRDLKRLVAYSSVGHLALVVIGLSVREREAVTGAVLQMVNHGITTPALFILVGVLEARLRTRRIDELGGLWTRMPFFSVCFLLFAMASLGLPGLNNFVGEILILLGAFPNHPLAATLACTALACTLVYILRMVQDTLFGPARTPGTPADVDVREALILAALTLAALYLAWRPGPALSILEAPVAALLGSGG